MSSEKSGSDESVVGKVHTAAYANFLQFIDPTRVLDTRSGGKNHPTGSQGTPLGGNANPHEYTADNSGELPAGALGIYASITAVPVSAGGWATAWETGPWPGTANLTWANNQIITNLSLNGLTNDETFKLAVRGGSSVHLVIDVLAIIVAE